MSDTAPPLAAARLGDTAPPPAEARSGDTAPPRAAARLRPGAPAATLAFLGVAALLIRLPQIGNPLLDIDEQFYLLVGDRLLHGALPYVDIWDRKPIGLFLLYAAIRLLGGGGVVQYQLVASVAAFATAAAVAAIARRLTNPAAAAAAGLIYLVWLNLLGGNGGQSPVFYNLATALAALAALHALAAPDAARIRRCARAAMLAMGAALLIKTTVLFEGALFGLTFLWLEWRRGRDPAAVVRLAAQLIAIALAPTLAAFAAYAMLGAGQAFWFANVASILLRVSPPNAHPLANLGRIMLVLVPLALAAAAGLAGRRQPEARFVAAWLAVATAGMLAVPPYYNHYGLPLVLPMAVAAAWAFGRGRAGLATAGVLAATMLLTSGWPGFARAAEARARLAALAAPVSANLRGGCLFVFQGPPILYQAAHACALSRYVFPAHLNYLGEANAIGVDPAGETRRILAAHPAVIVTSRRNAIVDANPATWRLVEAALAHDYRLVATGRADKRMLGIYARNVP